LISLLFEGLQTTPLSTTIISRIIHTTVRLASNPSAKKYGTLGERWDNLHLVKEVAKFCATFPLVEGRLNILTSAVTLARLDVSDWNHILHLGAEIQGQDLAWV
jgi:hypothetical protein